MGVRKPPQVENGLITSQIDAAPKRELLSLVRVRLHAVLDALGQVAQRFEDRDVEIVCHHGLVPLELREHVSERA